MEGFGQLACMSRGSFATHFYPCSSSGLQGCFCHGGQPLHSKFRTFRAWETFSSLYSSKFGRPKSKTVMDKVRTGHSSVRLSPWNPFSGKLLNHLCKRSLGPFVAATFGDKEASRLAVIERSEIANEEILLFFFQLDLGTRVQCALNMDQYDLAQQLREQLVKVEQEMARQREQKLGCSFSKDEAQDIEIKILRLRDDLRKAIAGEDYAGAAKLRDRISTMEAESLAAAAKALAYRNLQYAFRLGQRVNHARFGYRGVICGMDPLCCESEMWISTAAVENLSCGRNQPFYQVLVDMRDDPTLVVAYVAEENLAASKEPNLSHFDHPYTSFLFYGTDAAGDFIPIKQLREKYEQARHELS